MNEIELVELFTRYLTENNVKFTDDGFPLLKEEWFINNKPKIIAPFNKRQYYRQNKKDISICYFGKDEHLYPRLEKIFDEISILKEYHSACMMDISVSPLMHDEVQRMNLLLNLLFVCVVAVNGIKIIPSFRTGSLETLNLLMKSVGKSKYWVMAAVGTQRVRKNAFFEYLFRTKCLLIIPEHLLVYGRPNVSTSLCLNDYGIKYEVYKDFRSLSYSKEVRYG
jgi:hypothetical protein